MSPLPKAVSNFDIDSALTSLGNPFQYTDLGVLISKIIEFLMLLGAIAALIFLVWGGLEWILSGGDKQGTEKARSRITDSIIGLFVLFAAWTIFQVLQVFLGIDVAEKTLISSSTTSSTTTSTTPSKPSCNLETIKYNWVLSKQTQAGCIKNSAVDWSCWQYHITNHPCDNFYISGDNYWWDAHKECSRPSPLSCP